MIEAHDEDVSEREIHHLGARYLAEMFDGWSGYWQRIANLQAMSGPAVLERARASDPDAEKAFEQLAPMMAATLHPEILEAITTAAADAARMIRKVVDEWPDALDEPVPYAVERAARKATPGGVTTETATVGADEVDEPHEPLEDRVSRLETMILGAGALFRSMVDGTGLVLLFVVLAAVALAVMFVPPVPDDTAGAAVALFS